MEILLVEDDLVSRRLLERNLTMHGHTVDAVDSAEKALEHLQHRSYPMLFLDIGLPGMSGLDLIRAIRKNDSEPPTYVLVGTGETGAERMNEILEAGADDYVAKPYQKSILDTRLVVAANSVESLRERSRLKQELTYMAQHDPLTGLLNRRQLDVLLKAAIDAGRPTVLLQLDLDHFKQINDTFGHLTGDKHLMDVADLLREMLPVSSDVVRLGGDEFVALVPGYSVRQTFERAKEIIDAIRKIQIVDGNYSARSGASIGITNVHAGHSAADLLKEADLACYRAKSLGKSCAQVYVPFDPELFLDGVAAGNSGSSGDDRLELWFQPVCKLQSGEIFFHEALLRFLPAENKPAVDAAMFMAEINQAENAPALDRFVVRRACSALVEFPSLTVSVNVDSSSICDWEFVEFVRQELERGQLEGTRLILEITETHAIPDLGLARSIIEQMAVMHVRCILDDLGAGFNSITLLKHLPIRLVKVDGELIRDLSNDRYNRSFIEALGRLADGLNFQTVGERIETAEEWCEARQLGISYGQGHLIGAARRLPYEQSELDLP
jgi:diguanylate cyclase (GGDEF)-like protein